MRIEKAGFADVDALTTLRRKPDRRSVGKWINKLSAF